MLYVLIPLGVAALGGVVYLAISKKSAFIVRISALTALALMVWAVIISIFVIFGEESASKTVPLPDAIPSDIPSEPPQSLVPIVFFVVFVLAFFALILVISLREQRRSAGKKVEPIVKDDW